MDRPLTARASLMRRKISDNLTRIRQTVGEAAAKVGRDPDKIALLAVTKAIDLEGIRALLDLGHRDLGESRVQQLVQRAGMIQEYLSRRAMLGQDTADTVPRWHMVGHLQRNKVKTLLPVVAMIHSVDTLRLAEEINNQGGKIGRRIEIILEVNCSGEAQKFGMPVAAVGHFIEQILPLPNLHIRGLMTMAAAEEGAEKSRPVFERLYELFLETKVAYRLGKDFEHLSIGMSQDYRIAVECGATILRIGTAVFEGIEASA